MTLPALRPETQSAHDLIFTKSSRVMLQVLVDLGERYDGHVAGPAALTRHSIRALTWRLAIVYTCPKQSYAVFARWEVLRMKIELSRRSKQMGAVLTLIPVAVLCSGYNECHVKACDVLSKQIYIPAIG